MLKNKAVSDEMLEGITGGTGITDDAQANGKCPFCAVLLKKAGKYYTCSECGSVFDKYGNEIGENVSARNGVRFKRR